MHSKCKETLAQIQDVLQLKTMSGLQAGSSQLRWWHHSTIEEASRQTEFANMGHMLDILRRMKEEWRKKERLKVPEAWMPSVSPLQTPIPFIPDYSIGFMTAPIQSKILQPLTNKQLVDRHNHMSIKPDFCLSNYRIPTLYPQAVGDSPFNGPSIWQLQAPCTTVVGDLMMYYTGKESIADYAISGPFVGIPSCWLTRATNSYLPTSLTAPAPALDLEFAVLPHPQRSSSPANTLRDASLSITLAHPAILLAMKGPTPWEKAPQPPTMFRDVVKALSLHAQSSLQALRLACGFRHVGATSLPPLPNDAIIFGLIYDSREVHLVAHFWASDTDLMSVVVDTLDFPSDVNPDTVDFAAWSENRVRLVLALLTVQRHTFRLATLWDDVQFPSDISRLSSQLDAIIMGPEPTSPMCGTDGVIGDPNDPPDFESQAGTGSIYSEISDASDYSEDCPSIESQVRDTGDIDGSESSDFGGCEDCGGLVCVCTDIGEEKQLSAIFWTLYDEDPLCYEDDIPAYWTDILKHSIWNPFPAIPVPGSWLCSDSEKSASLDTSITSMAYALDLFIKSVLTFAHDTTDPIVKTEKLKAMVYKCAVRIKPILTLNDLPRDHPQSIRSAMLAFFAHSCSLSYERRLIDVMVPALSGFLYVPGCRVSCSFPHPDDNALFEDVLESRVIIEGLPETHWPSLIVAMPWDARPLQDGSAPLTKYFERSLRILTTLYSETTNPTVLPPWCVLIGIVYGPTGFRVYAHYPLWNQEEDRWDYISVQLCNRCDIQFSESYIRDSCSTAYVLLCIQRHAHEVQVQLRQSIHKYGQILQTLTM